MNIPTALEARTTVENGEFAKRNEQLKRVEVAISKAIAGGRFSASLDEHLGTGAKNYLENLGYTVEMTSHRNESMTSISW